MNDRTDMADAERVAALAGDLRALIGKFKRRLREQSGSDDFTPSQITVLMLLEREGPMTMSNLARAEGMRPQSMGHVVGPLLAEGFVAGTPDPNDGRQTILALTDISRKWVRQRRAARQDWLSGRIRDTLSSKEQRDLANAVELLKRVVGD